MKALLGVGEGFRDQASISWTYRGTGNPVQLLVLGSALGGNVPIQKFWINVLSKPAYY